MSSNCPVCNTTNAGETLVGGGNEYRWLCLRCGEFTLAFPSGDMPYILADDVEKRGILSHWIRTKYEILRKEPADEQGGRRRIYLSGELVNNIIRNPRPSPPEQADNFVRWIGNNGKTFDEYIDVDKFAIQAIVGSATFDEFVFVFGHLKDEGVIQHQGGRDNVYVRARLSFLGWERYHELKQATSDSRKAFMAMQYDNEQLVAIFADVFKDAVEETGFDLCRLVDMPQPAGLIDDDLRVKIRASRFLIADLTDRNPGAYWEAGYAEGLGKPVIYTCRKDVFEDSKSCPHFDTNHHLTILWDSDQPQEAREKLKTTIRATLPAEAKLTDD